MDAQEAHLRPKGEAGYETSQQRAVRELEESKLFFSYQGCLHHTAVSDVGRKGKSMASTGRLTSMGSMRKRPDVPPSRLGLTSPASEANALASSRLFATQSSGRRLGSGAHSGIVEAEYMPQTIKCPTRPVSLPDLIAKEKARDKQVNYAVGRMLDRKVCGGFFCGSQYGAARI
eukprot:TRINITY_DN24163_c0_g1_i1.p1 TRINITY_DN24163_c0_g1~~TRINITY_DN24163_c0_g1_i1.p1  ORF type:complete len:174 (+),score=26.43 TRINITY_DN24163_c0_g1_i1:150-671(+)